MDNKHCPFCGGEMVKGSVYMSSGRGASLVWLSRGRVPRKHPVRLFGRSYFTEKKVSLSLLSTNFGLFGMESDHISAPFCPICKKVICVFDAKVGKLFKKQIIV